jgi:hypothetical protein
MLNNIIAAQGWSDSTVLSLMKQFLINEGLEDSFAEYAQQVAEMSKLFCSRCGHSCPEHEICNKCSLDPMMEGDTLCVECDRDLIEYIAHGGLAKLEYTDY